MTTNDGTRSLVIHAPWNAPMARPTAIAAAIDGHAVQPCLTLSTAIDAAANPLTAPTERSISPSSRTSTMPTEIVPMAAICSMRLVRLTGDRNRSFRIWKTIQMTTMPSSTGQVAELALGQPAPERPGSARRGRAPRRSAGCRASSSVPSAVRTSASGSASLAAMLDVRRRRPSMVRWSCGTRRRAAAPAPTSATSAPVMAATTWSAVDVGRVERGHPPPEAQHDDAVGDREHVDQVVADHDHAEALARAAAG